MDSKDSTETSSELGLETNSPSASQTLLSNEQEFGVEARSDKQNPSEQADSVSDLAGESAEVKDITRDDAPYFDTAVNIPQITPSVISASEAALMRSRVMKDEGLIARSQWLKIYLVAALLFNLLALFLSGHLSDMTFWSNWTKQLAGGGYKAFHGDYPPIYIHWLWLVSKFYLATESFIATNLQLKFFAQLPIALSHCVLISVVYKLLNHEKSSKVQFHSVLLFTVFNPALLLDGPIWGQVDVFPTTIALISILLGMDKRWAVAAVPLYCLALLTKFQMICFAPVFAILFFTRPKVHIIGCLLAIPVFLLGFAPFILVGEFKSAFEHAYINTLGQYPYGSLNAANLPLLLFGNMGADSDPILQSIQDPTLRNVLSVKHVGMLSFALFCCVIFVHGLFDLIKQKHLGFERDFQVYILRVAMLCALGFFTLLPAMHERYIMPSVIIALAYVGLARTHYFYAIMLTLIAYLNIDIILRHHSLNIFPSLALMTSLTFAYAFVDHMSQGRLNNVVVMGLSRLIKSPKLALVAMPLMLLFMAYYLTFGGRPDTLTLDKEQLLLSKLEPLYSRQDHGKLHVDRSYDGNFLSLDGQRYGDGLGTHSNSVIRYKLPDQAQRFSFIAGIDDEVGKAGAVVFVVRADNKEIWRSQRISGSGAAVSADLDVSGTNMLELKVLSVGSPNSDHANWVNPIITLDTEAPELNAVDADKEVIVR
ncbi:NPCBM/NEW2 domain-containing protein [Agaribacterium sp. ZY112]|uniref:NPCBM/NEW2 domain-containing protein n=1 Tax=Agaribacterium sp. ZY112 TaxID=3233574 RepID=UPI0035265CF8